jgi:hypothetical protein
LLPISGTTSTGFGIGAYVTAALMKCAKSGCLEASRTML